MIGHVILRRAKGGLSVPAAAGKAELGWLAGELPGEPVMLFTQTANARSRKLVRDCAGATGHALLCGKIA
jgi:hypothetical protein